MAGLYRTLFHNWSNAYYQYENGSLEEAQWLPNLREMKVNANNPICLEIWADWKYLYNDKFQDLMDHLITEADD